MINISKVLKIATAAFILLLSANFEAYSQRVGFICTDQIRELFPEAKQADQRLETIKDEWKREIKEFDQQIEAKKFEIDKNRLIWTDAEKATNEATLEQLKNQRMEYAKVKYSVGGEYEKIVAAIAKPVEEKIYAAIQKVAAQEKYDMVWDKSVQPLSYVNFKYDLTLKVLKELGVDVAELEKEQQDKINKDPRNSEKNRSKETPTKKTRKRRTEINKDSEAEKDVQTDEKVEEVKTTSEPTKEEKSTNEIKVK